MKISRFKTREKTGGINEAKRKDLIFYVSLMALPVAQFLIFYIGVNARSVLYAFQNIDLTKNSVTFTFDNFKNIFNAMRTTTLYSSLTKISLISYAVSLVVGVPLGLFFSFYIAEKMPFANGFRVALFLPSIISAITMVTIYRFFVEIALADIVNDFFHIKIKGLLENPATRFSAIMFYNVFIGFGTSVLMYSNSMSGISEEVIEAAKLDGATGIKKIFLRRFSAGVRNGLDLSDYRGRWYFYKPDKLVFFLRGVRARRCENARLLSVRKGATCGKRSGVSRTFGSRTSAYGDSGAAYDACQTVARKIRVFGGLIWERKNLL